MSSLNIQNMHSYTGREICLNYKLRERRLLKQGYRKVDHKEDFSFEVVDGRISLPIHVAPCRPN